MTTPRPTPDLDMIAIDECLHLMEWKNLMHCDRCGAVRDTTIARWCELRGTVRALTEPIERLLRKILDVIERRLRDR